MSSRWQPFAAPSCAACGPRQWCWWAVLQHEHHSGRYAHRDHPAAFTGAVAGFPHLVAAEREV
ncbi:hypothetical protein [Actinoplanes sp. NPDC051494]|uniref:hypothetical protein n=1 Tax=Actinoplanes sp. NPDC051494 TaxID=3363907 RepID=UPI0037953190